MSCAASKVVVSHRTREGRRYYENDPVEVNQDCSARSPGRLGTWKHVSRGRRGLYKHPVHGDNRFALVEFHDPIGDQDSIQLLEIDLQRINHVSA